MAQQWPTTAPSVSPGTHDPVATQAYQAGGGDYFRSGYYSHSFDVGGGNAAASLALISGRMPFVGFHVPVRRAFDRIGINVTTAATAASGGLLRFGIYGTTDGRPGALLLDAGTVSSETTGAKEVVISQTLDPGLWWLAVACQVSGCSVAASPSNVYPRWVNRDTLPISAFGAPGPYINSVTGALPNPAGVASVFNNQWPLTMLRAA